MTPVRAKHFRREQGPSEVDGVMHGEATQLGKPKLQKETPAERSPSCRDVHTIDITVATVLGPLEELRVHGRKGD